jgi:hypothetical protein
MPITPYTRLIRLISDGEPVNAAVTNRAPVDLSQRTQHLKEILDALQASQLIQIPDVILQAGMDVGTPVYLDIPTNTYRPAVSAGDSQEAGNPALPSAYFAGVIVDKTSDTRGTLGTFGRFVGLTLTDWAAVVPAEDISGGDAIPGHYFLSSVQAGRMTRQPGGLGVYVGELNAEGIFFVKAGVPDYAAHTHHRFTLSPLPAVADLSTDISQDGVTLAWSITAPDLAERGWLPAASQPAQNIPPGLPVADSFYYNIDHPSDAALRALFPPVPVDSFTVVQGGLVQPEARVVVNAFGIWWTQNRNVGGDAAPWSDNVQSAPNDEAPIEFWFSRILLPTDGGIVRRLVVDPASPIPGRFVDASGDPATDGALRLFIDGYGLDPVLNEDAFAIKALLNGLASAGPVVSRVRGGAGIGISGSHGDATNGWFGALTLSLVNTLLTQGVAASADLNNAREESIQGARAVSLVAGRTASPTWTVQVSPAVPPTSTMRIRFWVHFTSNAALPTVTPLTVAYKILPPLNAPGPIPGAFTSLSVFTDATAGIGSPRQGLYQLTSAFNIPGVPAGSTVLIQLNRTTGDGLAGNVNILRVNFELV